MIVSAASEVTQILEDERINLTASLSDFWVLAAALKQFVAHDNGGDLPLEVITSLCLATQCLGALPTPA